MSYVHKTHKINFALDDFDIDIVMRLRKQYHCTTADLFRRLLQANNIEVAITLMELQREIHEVRQDLIKLVRSK